MLRSMTGFSTKNVTIKKSSGESIDATLLLKSLNARYFEVVCKLPFALTHLETDIIKLLKTKLVRGTIYVTVQINNPEVLKTALRPSLNKVENYLKILNDVKKRFKLSGNINISDVLYIPDIFEFSESLIDEKASKNFLKSFEELANILIKTRQKEGNLLEKDILFRIDKIQKILVKIEKRAEIVAKQKKEQLLANFETTIANEPSQARDLQLQMLQTQLDKYQISEEIVRFGTHIKNLKSTVEATGEEKGKKIDFITQELFREINTLTSKANDADLSDSAIAIKIELEKIREQNQNVL